MEVQSFSVYGIPPRSREQIILDQHRLFMYMEALIKAERLNPELDYDGNRDKDLLRRIAVSDLTLEQRTTLTILLLRGESNEEDDNEREEQEEA